MRAFQALCLALSLIACGLPAAAEMRFDRGTGSEPNSLDPHKAIGSSATIITYDLFEGLVTLNPDGSLAPGQAEAWSVSEDGLEWSFTLRPDLRWSDGSALTASDVVWSLRRLMTPETAARFASLLYPIDGAVAVNRGQAAPETLGVSAPDDRTVILRLEAPKVYFPQLMSAYAAFPLPRHVIEAEGDGWARPGTMVTNGAYVPDEWVQQSYLRARKNPNYRDAAGVAIDTVTYWPTENLTTSLQRYRAGELDVALNFPPDQLDFIAENLPGELVAAPALGLYYVLTNTERAPLDDPRVRAALSLAIDRETLTGRLLTSGVVPAYGIVPPVVAGYDSPPLPLQEGSLAARQDSARSLLAEAGFTAETPLNLTYAYDTLEENRRVAVALAAMWRAIGVEVTLENAEFRTITGKARRGDFDLLRYTWYSPVDDAAGFLTILQTGASANNARYSNPDYDALLQQADAESDAAARLALLRRAEALAMADHPVIPIYFYVGRTLVKPYIEGWVPNARSANLARFLRIAE